VSSKEKGAEKRINPRAKLSRMSRVRPSEGDADPFEELPISTNVSKRGIYFHTNLEHYRVGMRLFVTYPFTFVDDPMKSEYLAEVFRVERLADTRFGVAIRLLMTI
jgi:hypothetical protein